LYAVLSTSYGSGNGTTTFNLPDLRGRAPIGKDDLGGSAASRITSGNAGFNGATLGAAGGDERLHGHTHTGPSHTHTGPSHQHTPNAIANFVVSGGGIFLAYGSDFEVSNVSNTSAAGTGNTGASGTGATGSTGGGATQNVQPSIVVGYIIKT
jgi:microcystin-dependent protein